MKTQIRPVLATLVLLSTLSLQPSTVFAQGTAFTYQGRLNASTNPATGIYDLRFAIFDSLSAGSQQGSTLTNTATSVSNGLFVVALDFGNQFPGADRWLEIGVRTNGSGTFSTLSPRQKITPSPYAIYAAGASAAGISGTIPTANLTGTYGSAVTFNNAANSFSGNGTGLNNVNAISLGGLGAASFWVLGGNAVTGGANLGTGDNQPLNLISWNSRVLQLETKKVSLGGFDSLIAVNTLGGASGNVISNGVMGGTIAGGGAVTNHLLSSEAAPNTVLDNFGTVGGGLNNTAGYASTNFDATRSATVAGGEGNTASSAWATVGGGRLNTASGNFQTTVGGGILNTASGDDATVSGGGYNLSSGEGATVPGGLFNLASGSVSFAAGDSAQALHDGTFVWADLDPSRNPYSSTGTNQFCVRARGGIQVDPQTSMYFGSQTRQMLNLWGTQYGIGVQSGTVYFRTDNAYGGNGFAWFKGGTHNDGPQNPGGGTTLMTLTSSGLTVNGTFVSASDRNAKQDFAAVDNRIVLEKVAQLPIQTWAYKNDPNTKHLGPVAQDFYATFGIGPDDKHIATVDEGGVALAAIQGLNQKLNEKDAEIQKLKEKADKVDSLEKRLNELEQMVQSLAANK
jgi:hypothetical protein